MDRQQKIGVKQGGGPPPGYSWGVSFVDLAETDGRSFLNPAQYQHVVGLMKCLAMEDDPTHPSTVDVRSIDEFYELRDKGGILGKLNVRVFFIISKSTRNILILGVIKKEADNQTPMHDIIRIRQRIRRLSDFKA